MRAIVLASTALVFATSAMAAPKVKLGGSVTVTEGKSATVSIVKTGTGRAKFGIRTTPDSASEGLDFKGVNVVLSPYGSTAQPIPTVDDNTYEGPERFKVQLYAVSGSKTIVDTTPQYVNIADNDLAPPPPPPPVICPDGSSLPAGSTCPVVTPPPPVEEPPLPDPVPTGYIPSPTLDGAAPIQSEFDWKLALIPIVTPPSSGAPDVVGAFRFGCGSAGLGRFDPKVFPKDKTGKSHLHQFYGNTGVTPDSTYETLRTSGRSTCGYGEYPMNRSAYWEPAVLDGEGNVIQQDHSTIYYKQRPHTDPKCQKQADPFQGMQCVGLPNGLFFIFGFDFITDRPGNSEWGCESVAGGAIVWAKNIPDATAGGKCDVGGRLLSRKHAPMCWSGKDLDSPNHRDHMAFMTVRNSVSGQYRCDDAHPYIIPTFTLITSRHIAEGDKPAQWYVSSDPMRPDLKAGSTDHADFFMAHDPNFKREWGLAPTSCIQALLNCSGYPTGSAWGWPKSNQAYYFDPATGRLVPSWKNPVHKVPVPGPEANDKLVHRSY